MPEEKSLSVRFVWVVIFSCGCLLAPFGLAQPSTRLSQQLDDVLGSHRIIGGRETQATPRYAFGSEGQLVFLSAGAGGFFELARRAGETDAERATRFLRAHAGLLGIEDPRAQFVVHRDKEAGERSFIRIQQKLGTVPVFAGEAIVQLLTGRGLEFLANDMAPQAWTEAVPLEPELEPDVASELARADFARRYGRPAEATQEPELWIYAPGVLGQPGASHVTWLVELRAARGEIPRERIFVDALSGEVVERHRLDHSALNRWVKDIPTGSTRTEGAPPLGLSDADDAYDYLGDTYDFYWNEHGRDSIDGNGMQMKAFVQDPGAPNAYWLDGQSHYAVGWVTDDIVAHETTHGVTERESRLVYQNESGAINESISDMWGEWVDQGNGVGNDSANARWEVGEDRGSFRHMANPPLFSDPDRMGSPHFYTGSDDYGGVHTNSGVGNKLCYLLTDGDTFRGRTINGMGTPRTSDLFYEVQTNLLTSGADYRQLGYAVWQAAFNLGWSTADVRNVYEAGVAVDILGMFIDSGYVGSEDGSYFRPFDTIAEAENVAASGEVLRIQAGTYDETPTINQPMIFEARGGTVVIR
ncbi:MAG: M4 family metallopeptidase [Planctomycetota bacterium]